MELMKLKDILATRPEDMAADQELALQNYTADKLRSIANLIEYGNYRVVENELDNSESFISFDELQLSTVQFHTTDIGDVIGRLQELRRMHKAMVQK